MAGCVLVLGLAQPVAAKTYCIFDTECFETDTCAEAAFRLDFVAGGNAGSGRLANAVSATTEFGDMGGYVLKQTQDARTYAFEADAAFYILRIEDRTARLSVQMPGPMAITYHGTCEDLG